MAQKIVTTIIDDFDETPGANTVLFSFNGEQYTIDLSSNNHRKFREMLGDYIQHARPVRGKRPPKRHDNVRPKVPTNDRKSRPQTIREWAKTTGLIVQERGRVPAEIVAKYEAAQSNNRSKKISKKKR